MSIIQQAMSFFAQTVPAFLQRNRGLRLRILETKSFSSLRSYLFDSRDLLAGDSPTAITLRPNLYEAPSLATGIRYHAENALPYRTQKTGKENRSTEMAIPDFSLPSPAKEPSALKPWTELPVGPNQKASTKDGKQITKQSKSPPERQSFRWAQSQPAGQSIQERRRGQQWSHPQPQPQRLLAG